MTPSLDKVVIVEIEADLGSVLVGISHALFEMPVKHLDGDGRHIGMEHALGILLGIFILPLET